MLIDAQGLEVTTDSPEAIEAIDQFTHQLLGYGNSLAAIGQAIEFDPTAVLANAHVAVLNLFAETADAPRQAAPYLKTAQANLAKATEREQLYVRAIAAWSERAIEHWTITNVWLRLTRAIWCRCRSGNTTISTGGTVRACCG